MLEILGKASSINVRKVLWTCAELDLPYRREDWGSGFRDTHAAEFLALNPNAMVPVLRDVGARSAEDLRAGMRRLREDVQARSIPPAEMLGATLTLSNFGTLFGRYANPVVVPPQVAILGAGGIRDEVVAWRGEMAIHPILPLSLSFDHRAATGGEAARFLKVLVNALEQPDG
ncbi:2-oxo acid dehydrogenase subunit E2 [Pseudomonas aeruginosa]|uniref:2-oxo acid dehydrogenase subunit E2 n=1 Tax=Pseudomonas aeruginosa TaxID=287 RepID=UPI0005B8C100|nr:2-oxo acid dehydrogenase subunit E2 [Pseudomonas aeruginosa]